MKRELKIFSPTGIVGYGFPEESFRAGLALEPDVIACDAGSTDPGPFYLGSGIPFTNAGAVKRDLTLMIAAACERNIPLIIGTAGGSGADVHVAREIGIVKEIAKENDLKFKLAVISAELSKEVLLEKLNDGKLEKLGPAPVITKEDILASTHIAAQMGIEPIIKALNDGAQIILCGRCYDPAPFAAPAVRLGYDEALALHLGKLLECACICATPGSGADCIMGYLGEDYFRIEPISCQRACTPITVSAHTMYEKTNPYLLPGPGGTLDLSECEFIADSDRCTRVKGSKFIPEDVPSIKIEGAKLAGYRTISICGNRDAIFIDQIDAILEDLKIRTAENLSADYLYNLDFIVYGKNGVMGKLEPKNEITSHEVGIIIDVVADTKEHANAVCSVARSTLLHYGYPGRIATAGNLAFPFSPSDIAVGDVYLFSIYGLLRGGNPLELFPCSYEDIGGLGL